jgi:hypothetical protein
MSKGMALPRRLSSAACLLPLLLTAGWSTAGVTRAQEKAQVLEQHQSYRAGGVSVLTTTTRRTYPFVPGSEVGTPSNLQDPSSETVTLSQLQGGGAEERLNAVLRNSVARLMRETMIGVSPSGRIDPARPTELQISAKVTAAAPGIVVANLSWYVFPHDMIKGWGTSRPLIWSLEQERAIAADDLFDPSTRWWTALVPLMMESAYEAPVTFRVEGYEEIDRDQTPDLSPDGVWMKFNADESGSFVLDQPVFLPWAAVRPYLRKSLPFDPSAIARMPE